MTFFRNRLENWTLLIWTVVLLFLGALFVKQVRDGVRFETNILELLPRSDEDRVFETIRTSFQGSMGRTVLILLERSGTSSDSEAVSLREIRDKLRETLQTSSVFRVIRSSGRSRGRAMHDLYFPYRYQMLAPATKKRLSSDNPVRAIERDLTRKLHSHAIARYSDLLDRDPLLLFPDLVRYWQQQSVSDQDDGKGDARKNRAVLIGRLGPDPLEKQTQVQVRSLIEDCRRTVRDMDENVSFRWSGLVRFAMASRRQMQKDARFIGLISIIGVLVLVLTTFRSIKQLVLLVATVGAGLLTAVSISQLFYDLHVITVAFGASLIGICVDYAFHYFADYQLRSGDWTARDGLKRILPGILLGLVTSLMAFGSLSMTPMPALKQMALFTCLGLTGAFLTVVCCYPAFFQRSGTAGADASRAERSFGNPAMYLVDGLLSFWRTGTRSRLLKAARAGVGLVVLVIVLLGLPDLEFNDHIKNLDPVPKWLIENDRYIQRAAGLRDTGRYVLVEASSPQDLLEKQERVHHRIKKLQEEKVVEHAWSLYPFLPSEKRQKQNRSLLRTTLLPRRDALRTVLREQGFKKTSIRTLFRDLETRDEPVLTPEEWTKHPASFGLGQLWLGAREGTYSLLMVLDGIRNESRLRKRIESIDGVYFRNRARKFNELLLEYRQLAMNLTGVAYVLITLLLILRYGFLQALLALIPAVGGSICAIALLSLNGIILNMMHLLALLLLLGMGIDYAVFLAETHRSGKDVRSSMLALVLSALTTVLSFGCLAFSPSRVIQSLGMMVFPGILMILFLSPLVYYGMGLLNER